MLAFGMFTSLPSSWAEVLGSTNQFTSPRGLNEKCVSATPLPEAVYSPKDKNEEKQYCAINFYGGTTAICPKVWSTSPGTMIHDITGAGKTVQQTEATLCYRGTKMKSIAKFKTTMNRPDTSATNAGASIVYYHLSRLLNATVDVPVAVYRTMDKDAHYARVSAKAKSQGSMNTNAWNAIRAAEKNPKTYQPTGDLFTEDREQIYGAILHDKGERYGYQVNGRREGGWGDGQNLSFQKTAPFLALTSELPLREAIRYGLDAGRKNGTFEKSSVSAEGNEVQLVLWMKELTEISILDHIMNQQDRVGNVDFRWYWIYKNADGQVKSTKADSDLPRESMTKIKVPAEIAAHNPVLVQKSSIGDNDSGGMPAYTNYARRTGMVTNLRHIHADTYKRVLNLKQDMDAKGPVYQTLATSYNLTPAQLELIRKNASEVGAILQRNCESQKLNFDLVGFKQAYLKDFTVARVNCRTP